ncbi:MAG: translation initiation factor 2 [Oscillospiraceae bacterium]|nr:translation initiation factor 2 [Oscillospiraceae bacterium]
MVKGTSRRVIVVESPDPEFFEQAIFIVRNDVYERQGVTAQQVLGEACRIARGYAVTAAKPAWKKIPWWGWMLCAAAVLLLLVIIW